MKKIESECNGCAECICCGRMNQQYTAFYCDECGEEIEKDGYRYNKHDYCKDCFARVASRELNAEELEVEYA